ncbi:hypothetical protein DFH08DRAFT_856850 [Mycena albidolilacea]|uniref:Uncharacterized protein n=1 Tax=Mycena albidolilacea TaxID=1033008 RepID=A0AAD7EV05_9AGAR|nr:hypothetical protein DFH08DRAFT_856850 [Mycena albidolilacea]
MATLRQVLVDDTDPSVQYGPEGWFVADPSKLNLGNFGPIYNATSHATTSSNSTLSYSFNGTSILVQGTIDTSTDANNVTDPTWDCFVDGIKLPPAKPSQFPENNWPLCQQDTIASGSHVLTIQVKSQGQAFYFDSLVYTPILDAVFPSAVLIYADGDTALNYSSGWKEAGEQVTQTQNAQVTLNFHGTSATLIGHIPEQFPPNATSASYTIDGGTPITFPLHGLPSAQSPTQFNSLFFTTPTLSDGFHSLTVTHDGDIDHTPLAVKYFYVTNTTGMSLVQPSVSFPGPSAAATSPTSPSSSSRRSRTGVIAGGVVGGLVLLVLLAVLCFWRRKRKTRDLEEAATNPYSMAMADGAPPRALLSGGFSETSGTSELGSVPRGYKQMPVAPSSAVRGGSDVPGRPSLGKGVYTTSAPVVLRHEDSGIRQIVPPSSATAPEIVELPPGYSLT